MKWFDQWFFRKWQWAWENRDCAEPVQYTSTAINKLNGRGIVEEDISCSWSDGLRINLKKMNGGHVVSFRYYNNKLDRNEDQHYIITDEQDLTQELGRIITLESMRQT